MNQEKMFSPEQVGERVKQRRRELKMSMQDLGEKLGVNKSTIQRYETAGVDPTRTMIIKGIAEALFTTPEWLTGQTDDAEYDTYSLCRLFLDKYLDRYLNTLITTVTDPEDQMLLSTVLGHFFDLYAVFTQYWEQAMKKVNKVSEDKKLVESLGQYSIGMSLVQNEIYQKQMEVPVSYMKEYMDGLMDLYTLDLDDSVRALCSIIEKAQRKLTEKKE